MTTRIRLRRDTAATWASVNPILLDTEPGVETDTGKLKIGDGSTAWNDLDYFDNRLNQAITTNLTPIASNTYTIGTESNQWNTAWLNTLNLHGAEFSVNGGNLTIDSANIALESYVVNLNADMLANVDAANAAIVTANTALKNYTDDRFTALVNGAPQVLDTLFEIANSLGNNESFSTTIVTWMGNLTANVTATNAAIVTANSQVVSYVNDLNTAMLANVNAANAAIVTANVGLKSYVDSFVAATTGDIEFTNTIINPKTGATDNVYIATSAYQWHFAANGATIIPGGLLASEASVITSTGDVNLTAADDVNITAQGKNVVVTANDTVEINGGDRLLAVATTGGPVNITGGDGGSNPSNYDGGPGGSVTLAGGAGGLVANAITINSASQASPVQIVTAVNHGNPEKVLIAGAAGMTGLNGSWYVTVVNGTTLNLYTDEARTVPLNGTGFPAYTGSGTLTARRIGGNVILAPNPGSTSGLPGRILVNGTLQFQDGTRQSTAIPTAPYYANSTARDAAIPSPTVGMMVIVGSTFQGYNGSSWVALS